MSFSRRVFLDGFTAAASMAMLPLLKGGQAQPEDDTVRFEIRFSGPFAFVSKASENVVHIFAPITKYAHFPVISTDSDERLLQNSNEYELVNVQPSQNPNAPTDPVSFSVNNATSSAYRNCRIGITVPRPDSVKGIHAVPICLDGKPQGKRPTGLRFIYLKHPKNLVPTLKKKNDVYFTAQFDATDPKWELDMRMVPKDIIDDHHSAARRSFHEILQLCSVSPTPVLSYAGENGCAALKALEKGQLTPFRGPGSDCQTISTWIDTTSVTGS